MQRGHRARPEARKLEHIDGVRLVRDQRNGFDGCGERLSADSRHDL